MSVSAFEASYGAGGSLALVYICSILTSRTNMNTSGFQSILICLYHQTLWLALIRFLFIYTYNPGCHNEYDHLSYVVAVVTRATQHGESLLLPILQDLKAEYGGEGALTALLVA